jgi:hypothetical protein
MPVRILTTTEFLGPYGDKNYFGVTLQVASSDAPTSADLEAILRPWMWENISYALWRISDSSNQLPTKVLTVPPLRPQAIPAAALILRLNKQFTDLQTQAPTLFDWNSNPTTPAIPNPAAGNRYPWPAHLAQLARYPYPIPHELKLARFIEVDGAEIASARANNPLESYVIAPIFNANFVTYAPNQGLSIPIKGQQAEISYTASGVPSPLITAVVQPCAVVDCIVTPRSRLNQTTPLDAHDPYVSLASVEDSNWQTHLVPLAGELFDLASRLIGALRLAVERPKANPPSSIDASWMSLQSAIVTNFEGFRNMVLRSLKEVSGRGNQQPPGNIGMKNGSLLERVMDTWIGGIDGTANPAKKSDAIAFRNAFVQSMLDEEEADSKNNKDGAFDDWYAVVANIPASVPPTVPAMQGNNLLHPLPAIDSKNPGPELYARLAALEQLHFSLTQPEILAPLLIKQWTLFLGRFLQDPKNAPNRASYQTQWNAFLPSAQQLLGQFNLRQQFIAGNLGASWVDIIKGMNAAAGERSALKSALSQELKAKLVGRLTSNPSLPPLSPDALANPLVACLFTASDLNVIDTQLALIVPVPQADAAGVPTRTSNGITLTLDTLSSHDGDPNADAADILRQTAGFCILARENGKPAWNCLNVAAPCLIPETTKAPLIDLCPPTVIPLPLHNQDGLRQAMITFNNQPLMCESPAMAFGRDLASQTDTSGRLIKFVHPSIAPPPGKSVAYKIPGLIFGRRFDFVVGRVRNSCALPADFANSNDPGMLDVAKVEARFRTHGTTISYKRTVPIGELRFGPAASGNTAPAAINTSLKVPPIPAATRPRALDIPSSLTKAPQVNEPLILLTGYLNGDKVPAPLGTASFSFLVYKPTLDLLTWDCWVATDPAFIPIRKGAWADFHKLARTREQSSSNDVSIDDPAIVALQIEAQGIDGATNTIVLPWNAPSVGSVDIAKPVLQQLRSPALAIEIDAASSGTKSTLAVVGSNGAKLALAPGSLARLVLTPLIAASNVTRFAKGILPMSKLRPRAMYSPGLPYSLLAETALEGMPTDRDLRAAFVVTPQGSGKLSFTLNLDSPIRTFQNIRSATLRTQIWRWDGRPFVLDKPFPFASSPYDDEAPGKDILEWEDQAFATRTNLDANLTVMSPLDSRHALQVVQDISTDRGTIYSRSSVEAANRYGPLVPTAGGTVTSAPIPDPQIQPQPPVLWKRTLIPCRWSGPVPKPAIKLILPLTSSLDANAATASLLVVIQGPWYSIGGLAEKLLVELLPAPDTDANKLHRDEIGPDPIVWRGTQNELNEAQIDRNSKPPYKKVSPLLGPVGHTFDNTDDSPLWVNSSFVLPPLPTIRSTGQSWNFAKVRFRRVLWEKNTCDSDIPLPPDPCSSEYTDPYWVQFLPSSSAFGSTGQLDVKNPTAYLVVSGTSISIVDRNGNPIQLQPDNSGSPLYRALLLTLRVSDLGGRTDQERFLTLCSPNASQSAWALSALVSDPGLLVARVLEIQGLSGRPFQFDPDALWDSLFPAEKPNSNGEITPKDAGARIVAISPPIYPFTDAECR